ncbi:MAG: hypothetical protein ACPGSL_08115 [Vicingaceae bacterium]
MIKKNTLLLTVVFFTTIIMNAQKKVDPKHTNYYKIPNEISSPEYSLKFSGAVARTEFCKFALHLQNKTKDFLIFKGEESIFNFDFGKFSEKKKAIIVRPNGKKKKVLEVNGGNQFHVNQFNVDVDGIYKVPVDGKINEMDDFQVPASANSVSSDVFDVKLNPKKTSLKTQGSVLQFECTYNGNEIGILDPSKIVIKVEGTEKEYANDNAKSEARLMKNGDRIKFKTSFHIPGRIADMQFANMLISWKDAFIETKAIKLSGANVIFELDRGLTNGKN